MHQHFTNIIVSLTLFLLGLISLSSETIKISAAHLQEVSKGTDSLFPTPIKKTNTLVRSKKDEPSIYVIDTTYSNFQQGLNVICNGPLKTTGAYFPNVKVGLIRKNSNGQWDTIVRDGGVGIIQVGPEKHQWTNDTVQILLPVEYYPTNTNQIVYSGIFKLTYTAYKGRKQIIKSSNEFRIKAKDIIHESEEQICGFLDTTYALSHQIDKLEFHHSRSFTGTYEGYYTVWHKIRIYAPDAVQPHLFDQEFNYLIYPNSKTDDFFEVKDYDLDSRMDFRVKKYFGTFDYYLYDTSSKTFIYSSILSSAISFEADTEGHTLRANFSHEVPLEGTYDIVGIFSLNPLLEMNLVYFRRRLSSSDGLVLQDLDTRMLSCILRSNSLASSQPELQYQHGLPETLISTKRHYFPKEKIYFLSNTIVKGHDCRLAIEVYNTSQQKWKVNTPLMRIDENDITKIDGGIRIKTPFIASVIAVDQDNCMVLTSGTYRVKLILDGKSIDQTPEFYVYDWGH